jgi:hypothetical protein
MPRFFQILLFVSACLLAWLLMQVVHEFGHMAAAWATGGSVERVVLHPLAISRTDVEPNPHPLVVAWAGPVLGVLIPFAVWEVGAASRNSFVWLSQFFAGFCLIANGLYIGIGSFQRIGDAGEMIQHGSPRWTLWLFGLITAPAGLLLWNGLGPNFGIGQNPTVVNPRISLACLAVLVAVAVVEILLFSL